MANCPLREACIFFNDEMGDKPNLISTSFKLRFYQCSNHNCARWQVLNALGPDFIPSDLYPNQNDRVKCIIESQRGST